MKHIVNACLLAVMALFASTVAAADYPSKTVKVIVPFEVGGALDVIMRIVAQEVSEVWRQQVIVENRTGAGGNIGTQVALRAEPDGHTLLVHTRAFVINLDSKKTASFNPMRDFEPITMMASTRAVLLVAPALPVKSLEELITLAKSKPGSLAYASNGNGTAGHMNMELFRNLTGIDVLHVPYKSNTQAQTDLMSNRVQLWITTLPGVVPHIKAGQVRALAVTGEQRSAAVAVPTMKEAGVAGYDAESWYGMYTPAGTPRGTINKINADVVRILKKPELKDRFNQLGVEIIAGTPEHAQDYMRREITNWAKVIEVNKIRAD